MPHKIAPRQLLLQVLKMTPVEFQSFIRSEGIGMTKLAYRLGEAMNESDIPLAEACMSKVRDMYTRLDRARNMEKAMVYSMVGQFYNEAIQFNKALNEAKLGTMVTIAANQFGVHAPALSDAVHKKT